MVAAKVAVTLDPALLRLVDRWVKEGKYPNRSQAVQAAIRNEERRDRRGRLSRESARLSPRAEKKLANESLRGESWPEF